MEILRRKVGMERSRLLLDLRSDTHTGFGFWLMSLVSLARNNLSKQRASLWHFGSKTMNKCLHDGADVLDERETQQRRSLIGTALNVGQDRPETQYATEESARFMSDPTRAVKCMIKRAQTLAYALQRSIRAQLEFSISRNAVRGQSGDRGILGR